MGICMYICLFRLSYWSFAQTLFSTNSLRRRKPIDRFRIGSIIFHNRIVASVHYVWLTCRYNCYLISCSDQVLQFMYLGVGLGLISPSTFIAVNSYFTTRRGQAIGLAMAGTGLGQMIMPHVVRMLLDSYGFKGTILIMGGLALNGVCLRNCKTSRYFSQILTSSRINDKKPNLQITNHLGHSLGSVE